MRILTVSMMPRYSFCLMVTATVCRITWISYLMAIVTRLIRIRMEFLIVLNALYTRPTVLTAMQMVRLTSWRPMLMVMVSMTEMRLEYWLPVYYWTQTATVPPITGIPIVTMMV